MTAPGAAPATVHTDMFDFYDNRLAPTFKRNNRLTFCVRWEEHDEAVLVVQVLWDTWEVANRSLAASPDAMAVWLRDFAYPLLFDRLTISDGTFSGCSWREGTHEPDTDPLPR